MIEYEQSMAQVLNGMAQDPREQTDYGKLFFFGDKTTNIDPRKEERCQESYVPP